MFTAYSSLPQLSKRLYAPHSFANIRLSFPHTSCHNSARIFLSTSDSSRKTFGHTPDSTDPFQIYDFIEDVEPLWRYAAGGYYPVQIGEQFCKSRYRIVHKLGYGASSTTWLARDEKLVKYVAIKFAISGPDSPVESAIMKVLRDGEENDAKSYAAITMIPEVLDEFEKEGPEIEDTRRKHQCLVTTPARMDVAQAREAGYSRIFQPDVAHAIAAQLIHAVAYMHSRGIIHADLHEANILLRLPHSIDNITLNQLYEKHGQPRREPITRLDGQPLDPWVPTHGVVPIWFGEESNTISLANSRIFLTDFGKSFQPAVDARLSHTPLLLRSPELLLDPSLPVSFPDEIWSLACAVFFIMGQRPPFESWFPTEDVFLDEHVDALCRSPKELWTRWSNRNGKFDDQLQRIDGRPRRLLEERLEYSIQEPRRDWNMAEMSEEEKHDFLVLIRSMLSFEPENRPSAQQVLESRWMQKWANPVWESTENNMKT